jgi:glyoxylate carboligase
MGFLIRAAIVIGVVAAYAPAAEHAAPESTTPNTVAAEAPVLPSAVTVAQGLTLASDAARLLMSLPPETRVRVIETLTGATGTPRQAQAQAPARLSDEIAASSLPLRTTPTPPVRPPPR